MAASVDEQQDTRPVRIFSSSENFQEYLREYELQSQTHFICYMKDKSFGAVDWTPNYKSRIYFEFGIGNPQGIPLPFDGVPFMFVGRKILQCHRGPDNNRNKKVKLCKQRELETQCDHAQPCKTTIVGQKSKKKNCPARINITNIVKFPQYRIQENLRKHRDRVAGIIREQLMIGVNIELQKMFFANFPSLADHSGHPIGGEDLCASSNKKKMQGFAAGQKREANGNLQHLEPAPKHVRKHPSPVHQFHSDLTAAVCLKRTMETKPTTLTNTRLKARRRAVSQTTANGLVLSFICETLQPLSVVEEPSFKELVTTLYPQKNIPSKLTLQNKICEAARAIKKTLIAELEKVKYVATTTDCWSAQQTNYLGVTCHWIDEETLQRQSAVLACKTLKGSLTCDILARALDNIHTQFKIKSKLVQTTTDSGSNSIEALPMFDSHCDEEDDSDLEQQEDTLVDDGVQCKDVGSILEEDTDRKYQLPPHQRCACHLLSLVATTDAAFADASDHAYKNLSQSVFAKCHAVRNKAKQLLGADDVEETRGLRLICPGIKRWSCIYRCIQRILRIIDDKGEEIVGRICEESRVKLFSPVEVGFLREYFSVMKPLLKAINILQSDSCSSMGWLLPVIHRLQSKLKRLEASCKTCLPLIKALHNGLQKRFGQMMEDPQLVAATILLPNFKTSWTDKAIVIEAGIAYLEKLLTAEQIVNEHNFFSRHASHSPQNTELDGYLACASDSMDLLHSFPAIKQLSLNLNTGMAASAAYGQLYRCAGQMFTSKRSKKDSVDFENQLLYKLNKKYRK